MRFVFLKGVSSGCPLSGEGELFGVPRQDSGIPG